MESTPTFLLGWRLRGTLAIAVVCLCGVSSEGQTSLPGTSELNREGDLSAPMVAGIGRFLDRELSSSVAARERFWQADFSSRAAYEQSIAPNRARLATMLGVVDARIAPPELEYVASVTTPAQVAETDRFTVSTVRWLVLEGVWGEGLLLRPKGAVRARVVALPDADQTPEMIAGLAAGGPTTGDWARRLVENGCEVIIPTLLDRTDAFSGNPRLDRMTNQPHREWIYRQAYPLGRHVIGYEVQKILAAVDGWARANQPERRPIGVAGWGEGGMLAFYAAALDPRIDATLVSGYFGPRELLWQEPIYRNVFGLLREFGDAEIARLIVPRALILELAPMPEVAGPPAVRARAAGAAPGRIATPPITVVRAETERAKRLAGAFAAAIQAVEAGPLAESTLQHFVRALVPEPSPWLASTDAKVQVRSTVDVVARQRRQVTELQTFTQRLLPLAHGVRETFLWKKIPVTTPEAWREATRPFR